jgi:hypothetical protein
MWCRPLGPEVSRIEIDVEVGAHFVALKPPDTGALASHPTHGSLHPLLVLVDTAAIASACDPTLVVAKSISEALPGCQNRTGEAFESTSPSLEARQRRPQITGLRPPDRLISPTIVRS